MKTISRIAYSNDKRNRTKYTDCQCPYVGYDAACDYQYCGKWGNSFTEKVRQQDHMEAIMVCLFPADGSQLKK